MKGSLPSWKPRMSFIYNTFIYNTLPLIEFMVKIIRALRYVHPLAEVCSYPSGNLINCLKKLESARQKIKISSVNKPWDRGVSPPGEELSDLSLF